MLKRVWRAWSKAGVSNVSDKVPQLSCPNSWAGRVKFTRYGRPTPNRLNCCITLIVYIYIIYTGNSIHDSQKWPLAAKQNLAGRGLYTADPQASNKNQQEPDDNQSPGQDLKRRPSEFKSPKRDFQWKCCSLRRLNSAGLDRDQWQINMNTVMKITLAWIEGELLD